jgi:hypothetical protein
MQSRASVHTGSLKDVHRLLTDSFLDGIVLCRARADHWGGKEQPPSLSAGCMLRPYQSAGVRFLFSLFRNGINGILADEMGLGKTVQALALLAAVAHHQRRWCASFSLPLNIVLVPSRVPLSASCNNKAPLGTPVSP